jgi:CxxC-x17-CxxC domain-containing protein
MNKFRKPHGGGRKNERGSGERGPSRPGFEKPAYSPRSGGFRKDSGQKFDAICSNCGNACQVPFRPNGVKPVYCSNCFNTPRETSRDLPTRPSEQRTEDPGIADMKRQLNAMNSKIDSILRMLQEK